MRTLNKWIDVSPVCENEEFSWWFPSLSLLHNSWHCESLPNYHATTVYFGGGKNFLCVMIFVMDKFDYHGTLLQAKSANSPPRHLTYPYFCEYFCLPFYSLKDLYNSWDYDALLNQHNNVYFGSLVRTSCESCSFSMIYCSRLEIKASY